MAVTRRKAAMSQPKAPQHGESILGLPADLLIDPAGRVVALRFGRHADDQWSVDDLLPEAARATST
jgi:hypothetical protein